MLSDLLLSEQASSDLLAHWHFRPQSEEVGNPGPIFRYQRKGLLATRVCFWAGLQEELCQPISNRVKDSVMAVVFRRVCMSGGIPVVTAACRFLK